MKFGANLKRIRKALGITQSELAESIKVSQRTISHYEQGDSEPELITICRLAYAFNMSVETLLGYEGSKDPEGYKSIREKTIAYIERKRHADDDIRNLYND